MLRANSRGTAGCEDDLNLPTFVKIGEPTDEEPKLHVVHSQSYTRSPAPAAAITAL